MKRDLTGLRFDRWVVIKNSGRKSKSGSVLWRCRCDCGAFGIVRTDQLNCGASKSCGCKSRDDHTSHGHTRLQNNSIFGSRITPTYRSWSSMVSRCENPKNPDYKRYGGAGIKVCKRWIRFENFLEDMGNRPNGRTLNRKNNLKGYSKANCSWATSKEQANNRRTNRIIEIGGKKMTVSQWCETVGVSRVWFDNTRRRIKGITYQQLILSKMT